MPIPHPGDCFLILEKDRRLACLLSRMRGIKL
jgi:hypothetical protein